MDPRFWSNAMKAVLAVGLVGLAVLVGALAASWWRGARQAPQSEVPSGLPWLILTDAKWLVGGEVTLRGPWRDGPWPLPGAPHLLEDWDEAVPFEPLYAYDDLPEAEQRRFPCDAALVDVLLENPGFLSIQRYERNSDAPQLHLVAPWPGRAVTKGSAPVVSKAGREGKALPLDKRLLALCAGLSVAACSAAQVREVDTGWLEDCSAEARTAILALGLGTGEPYDVGIQVEPGRRDGTPMFIKEGPVVARWEGLHLGPDFPRSEVGRRMKKSKLFGRAKIYGDRMSVRFDRLRLADGRELPICAVGYDVYGKQPGLERWGPGSHPGIDVHNYDLELLAALKDLRPGEFPVAATTIWISFGTLFRPEWLSAAPRSR